MKSSGFRRPHRHEAFALLGFSGIPRLGEWSLCLPQIEDTDVEVGFRINSRCRMSGSAIVKPRAQHVVLDRKLRIWRPSVRFKDSGLQVVTGLRIDFGTSGLGKRGGAGTPDVRRSVVLLAPKCAAEVRVSTESPYHAHPCLAGVFAGSWAGISQCTSSLAIATAKEVATVCQHPRDVALVPLGA